jgi:hypothetical protein
MKHPNPMVNSDYLIRAVECERLAAVSQTAEGRETLMYLAKRWRQLAFKDQAKAKHFASKPEAASDAGGARDEC